MHLAEKIVDYSVGVEAFPFNLTLPHNPSPRVLFGLIIVPRALQGGMMAWCGQKDVPAHVIYAHRCSPIGLAIRDTK